MLPLRNKVLVINAGSSSLKFKLFGLNRAAGALGGGLEAASAGSGRSAEAVGSAADSAGSAAAGPASGAKSGLHPIASGLCEKIGDPSGDALMRVSFGTACSTKWCPFVVT